MAVEQEPLEDWDPEGPEAWDDPVGVYRHLQQNAPLAYSHSGRRQRSQWALTRYQDVVQAARDTETFKNGGSPRFAIPRLPLESDPPQHTAFRRLMLPFFGPARMQQLEVQSRRIVAEQLQPLLAAGGGDAAHDFARPVPPRVLLTFLNQPEQDWETIKTWCEDAFLQGAEDAERLARFQAANDGLWEYSRQVVESRQAAPRDPADDLVSALLAAEVDGQPMDPDLVVGVVRLLIAAGHDSTTSAMGICLHSLARTPEAQARLRAEPALIPSAIEEILRLETPVLQMPRRVARDVTVHGREMKSGDLVMLYWAAANRDENAFPDPDQAVLDRKPNQHVAFGYGIHKCIGAPLARLELRVALEAWLSRTTEFHLAGDVRYEP